MSDIKNKFSGLFGNDSSSGTESDSSSEQTPENIADYPDEINEEKPPVVQPSSDDAVTDSNDTLSVSDAADDEADQAEIEHDAKNYFNSTYQDSIDDKIKSIRENALNTYAKDAAEKVPGDDEKLKTLEADAVHIDSKITEGIDNKESGTRSYDMTQLIKILKSDTEDEADDDDTKGKKKKSKSVEFTDETDIVGENEVEKDTVNEYPHSFEFSEKIQGGDLFKSFRTSAIVSTISLVLTLIITALCFWIEAGHGAGLPFAHMLQPGYYGRVYAMASLQLLGLCVLINLDGLKAGMRKLTLKKAAPEAVALVTAAVCIIHTVYTSVSAYNSSSYTTYCFAGCLTLLFLSFNNFAKAYTRFKSFSMVLASKPKLTMVKLNNLSEECGVFAKYFIENSEAYTVEKTEFVSDFAKNTYTIPVSVGSCNILVYLSLILGVVTGISKALLFDAGIYEAVTGGVAVFMFAAPVAFLIVAALPYFITSARVFGMHNAIIGEAACDAVENAAVLSCDDTEVFPPKTVKVTSIKTYNDNRIDKAIVCMAKVFSKLGGPLSHVFASSVQDSIGDGKDVMVIESAKDGIHLTVDGEDVLIGTGNYLRMFDIEVPVDENDEAEIRSLTSILYLVNGGVLSAKFYIKYSMNRKFESLLERFYDAGICCGVKTTDPGVDDRLIEANLSSAKYPVSVVLKSAKDIGKTEEKSSGVLIGLSGIHNYLRSFIMLDRLRDTYKTNAVFAILGTIVGLAASMILVFSGHAISSGTLALFYLFLLAIIFLISFFRK